MTPDEVEEALRAAATRSMAAARSMVREAVAVERVRSAEVIARWKGPVSRAAMVRAILAREDGPPPDESAPAVSSRTELARWTADLPAPHVRTLVVELERDDGRVRGLQVRLFGDLGHIATVDLPMAFLGPALAGIPVEG